jgi:hypothetical protein
MLNGHWEISTTGIFGKSSRVSRLRGADADHAVGEAPNPQSLSLQLAVVSQDGFNLGDHVEKLYVDDFALALSVAIVSIPTSSYAEGASKAAIASAREKAGAHQRIENGTSQPSISANIKSRRMNARLVLHALRYPKANLTLTENSPTGIATSGDALVCDRNVSLLPVI